MSRIQWCFGCAAVCAFSLVSVAIAQGEDPFGGLEPAAGATPAAAAKESPADKKSAPAEQPNEEATGNQDFCRCVGETNSVAVARIEKALRSPLHSSGLDFTEAPLNEVVNVLQDDYGIPIQIDGSALEEIGLSLEEKVTVNIHNVSLRSALQLTLKTLQLTYIIQDEVLMITTPETAEAQLLTCAYNVRGFVDDTSEKSVDALIDTIVSCVSTDTWAENGGGEAEIRVPAKGLLVISQTRAVHEEIQGLLHAIRQMRDSPATGDAAAATPENPDQVVTRSFVLRLNQRGDAEKFRDQVREMIVQAMPDEKWEGRLDDGQPVMLTILSDRIVLRHTPAVQDRLEALVTESGVAAPAGSLPIRGGSSNRGGVDGTGEEARGLGGSGAGGGFGGNTR